MICFTLSIKPQNDLCYFLNRIIGEHLCTYKKSDFSLWTFIDLYSRLELC